MVILIPSIPGIMRRIEFASVVLILVRILFWVHTRMIPNTLVLIKAKPKGPLALAWPSILSWLLTVTSTVVAVRFFFVFMRAPPLNTNSFFCLPHLFFAIPHFFSQPPKTGFVQNAHLF